MAVKKCAALRVRLKRERKAAGLPKKRKPFSMFCEIWLRDRRLPKGERFKQAAAAWRNLPDERREEWKAKSQEEQLEWKAAAVRAGLYHSTAVRDVNNRRLRANSDANPAGADNPAARPRKGLSASSGEYSWNMSSDRQIGEGTFGNVYRGLHTPTGELVAIKVYKSGASPRLEYEVLQKLAKHGPHSPFPKCLSMTHAGAIQAIVMELFDRDLQCLLSTSGATAALTGQVADKLTYALHYMHRQARVLHLDVKSRNVLISRGDSQPKIALCDFSCCEQLPLVKPACQMYCTLHYRPLEFLITSTVPGCLVAPPVDWWSLGCLVWEVATHGAGHGFQHFFYAKTDSGVLDQCSEYIKTVHSSSRVAPSAYWPTRLDMAGPVWASQVKALCHPKPSIRTPKFEIPCASMWQ